MKLLVSCFTLAALMFSLHAVAQTTVADATQKASSSNAAPDADDDDAVPDINQSMTYEYHCELNDSLTIYTNAEDPNHIAMRWKNRLYRLKKIDTTTGAKRFENKKVGLVWIGIPTKGMLLDSRHGQQLANECKTAGQ